MGSSGADGRCHGKLASNSGIQFAIIGFVGYNFGCMIAVATRCLTLVVVKLSNEGMAKIQCLRVVATATNFGTKVAIKWLCVNDSD